MARGVNQWLTGFYNESAVFGQGEPNQTTLNAAGISASMLGPKISSTARRARPTGHPRRIQ